MRLLKFLCRINLFLICGIVTLDGLAYLAYLARNYEFGPLSTTLIIVGIINIISIIYYMGPLDE